MVVESGGYGRKELSDYRTVYKNKNNENIVGVAATDYSTPEYLKQYAALLPEIAEESTTNRN